MVPHSRRHPDGHRQRRKCCHRLQTDGWNDLLGYFGVSTKASRFATNPGAHSGGFVCRASRSRRRPEFSGNPPSRPWLFSQLSLTAGPLRHSSIEQLGRGARGLGDAYRLHTGPKEADPSCPLGRTDESKFFSANPLPSHTRDCYVRLRFPAPISSDAGGGLRRYARSSVDTVER